MLTADLHSRRLDFDDLGSLFGDAPSTRRGETASPEQQAMAGRRARAARLVPEATLQVERIRALDAKVTYRAETVNARGLPLSKVSLRLALKDGVLTDDPQLPGPGRRGPRQGRAGQDRPLALTPHLPGRRPKADQDWRAAAQASLFRRTRTGTSSGIISGLLVPDCPIFRRSFPFRERAAAASRGGKSLVRQGISWRTRHDSNV